MKTSYFAVSFAFAVHAQNLKERKLVPLHQHFALFLGRRQSVGAAVDVDQLLRRCNWALRDWFQYWDRYCGKCLCVTGPRYVLIQILQLRGEFQQIISWEKPVSTCLKLKYQNSYISSGDWAGWNFVNIVSTSYCCKIADYAGALMRIPTSCTMSETAVIWWNCQKNIAVGSKKQEKWHIN